MTIESLKNERQTLDWDLVFFILIRMNDLKVTKVVPTEKVKVKIYYSRFMVDRLYKEKKEPTTCNLIDDTILFFTTKYYH